MTERSLRKRLRLALGCRIISTETNHPGYPDLNVLSSRIHAIELKCLPAYTRKLTHLRPAQASCLRTLWKYTQASWVLLQIEHDLWLIPGKHAPTLRNAHCTPALLSHIGQKTRPDTLLTDLK